jgi:hypothetical protein
MIYGVNRVGPLVKWGLAGTFTGMIVGALVAVFRAPGWPAAPSADAAKFGAAAGGSLGMIAGILVVFVMILFDRMRYDIRKRAAAELKDPKVVPELYQDVQDGYVTDAWHAIGLLADYSDGAITKIMLESLETRLQNIDIYSADPGALVRHAVKSIIRTQSMESMEALKPYGRDFESKLGVEVRRLKRDLKVIEKYTSEKKT